MPSNILFSEDNPGNIFSVWNLRSWQFTNICFARWRWKSEMLGLLFFPFWFCLLWRSPWTQGPGGEGLLGGGRQIAKKQIWCQHSELMCFLYNRLQEAETCQLGCVIPEETAASWLRNKGSWGAEGEQEAAAAPLSLCCNSSWSKPASLPFRVLWGN